MSVKLKTITAVQLTASAVVYYTAVANAQSLVKKLTLTNTDTVPRTVTLYLVPSGGTPSALNILLSAQTIAAGECWECFQAQGQVLQAGGTIQALADVTAKVTLQGAIAEIS